MNKKDAIAFIKTELEKGTPEGEIIEVLMSQDKISTSNPTIETVNVLMLEAKNSGINGNASAPEPNQEQKPATDTPKPSPKASRMPKKETLYEEWKVEIKKGKDAEPEKIKKMRDMVLDPEVAERLNRSNSVSAKGYAYRYYAK